MSIFYISSFVRVNVQVQNVTVNFDTFKRFDKYLPVFPAILTSREILGQSFKIELRYKNSNVIKWQQSSLKSKICSLINLVAS